MFLSYREFRIGNYKIQQVFQSRASQNRASGNRIGLSEKQISVLLVQK